MPASTGVFANAALFHVPGQELPRVPASAARDTEGRRRAVQLEPRAATDTRAGNGDRYGAFSRLAGPGATHLIASGFIELAPLLAPRLGCRSTQQPWLASVWAANPRS